MMRPFNTALRRAPTLLLLFLAIVSVSRAQDYSTRVDAERDAKLGNPNAMRALAEMARDGVDGPQDLKLAAAIYFQLATKGLGFYAEDAAFELGYFYANGWGVEKNVSEAEKWFDRGAQSGVRLVELANLYAEGKILPRNDEKAVELYRKAGPVGAAEIGLGKMYEAGRGVPQSYEKAAEQYHNAAMGNTPAGQILYAGMLMAGKGVPKDEAAAMDWYQKSAQRRLGDASWDVYIDFAGDRGGRPDAVQAERWKRYTVAMNYDLAEVNLGNGYLQGKDEPRNLVDGFAWLTIARRQWSAAGSELEQFAKQAPLPEDFMQKVQARVGELQAIKQQSGGYYEDAMYGSAAPAIDQPRRLADDDEPLAQIRLAYAYQNGQEVPVDIDAAVKLYSRVTMDGPMELHAQVGDEFLEGKGMRRDFGQARDWLLRATDEGSLRAARLLGEMDRDGKGREGTSAMYAAMWFDLAEVDPLAKNELRDVEAKLTPEQKQKAQQLANTWRMKHPNGLH